MAGPLQSPTSPNPWHDTLKLRILSLAVIASLGAGQALATDHSGTGLASSYADLAQLEASAQGGNALAASKLAALYLQSHDPLEQAKALDVLAACDAQLHPICRVDLGMAYGRQALREDLGEEQRRHLAKLSVFRITHAANMGNSGATQLLQDLASAGLNGSAVSRATGVARDTAAAHQRPVEAVQQPQDARKSKFLKLPPLLANTKTVGRLQGVQPQKLEPTTFGSGFPVLATLPMPVIAIAAAEPSVPAPAAQSYSHGELIALQDKLEQAMDQLVQARLQLDESNKTIAALRMEMQAKQPPAAQQVDANSLNRRALDAAMVGNYETAIPMFRQAAELNHAGAINNLAAMFVNGTGVPRDMQQAVSLFERSAQLGNAEAAENAARIYNYGIGRGKDPSRARTWYQKAIQLGSARAAQELSDMEQAIQAGIYFNHISTN